MDNHLDSIIAGNIAIVGKTGSGKSFTAKGFAEKLLKAGKRICILDPTGVWYGLRSSADGKSAGFNIVVFGGQHGDVPIGETSGEAVARLLAERNLPAILDLSEFTMGGRTRFATAFFDTLYRLNRQTLTLIADEADLFAPQRAMPDQTVMLSRFEQIVRRGRVRGFRTWLITQRPAELHKSVLSQADSLIAMKLPAPQDRDAIGAWIEGQADRDLGKKILADLPKLPRGEGWAWYPAHDFLRRVHFPPIITYDSGRTPMDGETPPQVRLADVDVAGILAALEHERSEAAASDPRQLRAENAKLIQKVAALERELVNVSADTQSGVDKATLKQARESALYEGRASVQREHLRQLGALHSAMAHTLRAMDNARNALYGTMVLIDGYQVVSIPKEIKQALAGRSEYEAPPLQASAAVADVGIDTHAMTLHESKDFIHPPAPTAPGKGDARLSKAERLILTALAQYMGGRSKTQVSILTGYASSGGGFGNAIGALRTKGYLVGGPACLQATEVGIQALGDFTPLPTGQALLDYWLGRLGKAERAILQVLAEAYPSPRTKEQIADASGYEASGGGFGNAIGRLKTLELINGRGELRASEALIG